MPKKSTIEFVEVGDPLNRSITKFGGQPTWVSQPAWPLSRETGNPMRFVCQIKLSDVDALNTPAEMAYLFMTEEEDGKFVDGTWEPDGGENAVILQPGSTKLPLCGAATGPSLFQMVEKRGFDRLQPEACEFGVKLTETNDVAYLPEEERWKLPKEEAERLQGDIGENKLGGTPAFLQGDEIPFEDGWQFVLQLDSCSVPFSINFGDAGVGYVFMNGDGTEAKFLWQCC